MWGVIDELLGEHSAYQPSSDPRPVKRLISKPALRRAWWCRMARHKGYRRNPGGRILAGNAQGRLVRLFAITRRENFPGGVDDDRRTGPGQAPALHAKAQQKCPGFAITARGRQIFGGDITKNRARESRKTCLLAARPRLPLPQQLRNSRSRRDARDWFGDARCRIGDCDSRTFNINRILPSNASNVNLVA